MIAGRRRGPREGGGIVPVVGDEEEEEEEGEGEGNLAGAMGVGGGKEEVEASETTVIDSRYSKTHAFNFIKQKHYTFIF